MIRSRVIFPVLLAILALGIFLPATASAETSNPLAGAFTASTTSTTNCPSGQCYTEEAEWVPGTTITTAGGSGSGSGSGGGSSSSFVRETPVSKLKEIKKSYEKKYKVKVGYYQNPKGWQGPKSKCINPEKVAAWHVRPGEFYHTTDHLGHPETSHWHAGDKLCNWHIGNYFGHEVVYGTQFVCSNVHSWLPINFKIRKPHKVYVQFPTVEKFYEVAIKRLEIKSEAQGGSGSGSGEGGSTTIETPGHYQCKPGGQLNGKTCKYCPPPSCEPPCSSCEEKEPPCPSCESVECCVKFGNEFEFEEAYVNEPPIHYYKDIFAPKGHNLTIYFETEHAHFSTHEIKVPSSGAQSKFESEWFAPSHPGQYPVWVKVVDHTSGEICESEVQWVTVLPESGESPS